MRPLLLAIVCVTLPICGLSTEANAQFPFVDVGPGGEVHVRAPFVRYSRDRFGTRIRAPFYRRFDGPRYGAFPGDAYPVGPGYLPPSQYSQPPVYPGGVPYGYQPVPTPLSQGQQFQQPTFEQRRPTGPVPQPAVPQRVELLVTLDANLSIVPPGGLVRDRAFDREQSSLPDGPTDAILGEPAPFPEAVASKPTVVTRTTARVNTGPQLLAPGEDRPEATEPRSILEPPAEPESSPPAKADRLPDRTGSESVLVIITEDAEGIPEFTATVAGQGPTPADTPTKITHRLLVSYPEQLVKEYQPRHGVNLLALQHPMTGTALCIPVRIRSDRAGVAYRAGVMTFQDLDRMVRVDFQQNGMVRVRYEE